MDIKKIPPTAAIVSGVLLCVTATPALAYRLQNQSGGSSCPQDGSECKVFCDNGDLAGSMFWNNSVWTDGVKSDPDMDTEARKITAANGTACT